MSESLFLAQQKRIAKYSIFNMKRLAKGSESTAAPNLNPNLNPNWGSAAPPIQYVWGQDVDRFLRQSPQAGSLFPTFGLQDFE